MCWVPVARSGSPGIRPQRLNCYCSGWIAGRRLPMDRPARRVALEAGIRPIRNGGVEFEASARPPERRAEGRHRGRVMERRALDWTLGLEFPKQALARPWLSTCGRAGVKPGASQAGASTAVLASHEWSDFQLERCISTMENPRPFDAGVRQIVKGLAIRE